MLIAGSVDGGYYFIATPMKLLCELPIEITPGLRISKASPEQLNDIHQFLVVNNPFFASRRSLYELDWVNDKPHSWAPVALHPSEWRYHVLSFCGGPKEAERFQDAAKLHSVPIQCYPWALFTTDHFGVGERIGASSSGAMPYALSTPVPHFPASPIVVDAQTVGAWRNEYRVLCELDTARHPGIARAVSLFRELDAVPPQNGFRVLGLFMLLEMLLTHNPGDKEIGDSLSHQISTKIPLLLRRAPFLVDRAAFGNCSEVKLWKSLYLYRSKIAHGGSADFSKDLQVLKSPQVVDQYLTEVAKTLMRQALREPQLFDDLKAV